MLFDSQMTERFSMAKTTNCGEPTCSMPRPSDNTLATASLTRFPASVKSLVTLGLLPRLARLLLHSQDKGRISHACGVDEHV